jgi:hypothetical protein
MKDFLIGFVKSCFSNTCLCYIDGARTKNQPRTRQQATAPTNKAGRADAIMVDTDIAFHKGQHDSTQWKRDSGHKATSNPALEQNPTTTSSAQPELRKCPTQTKPAAAPACILRNLRGGNLRRAPNPAVTYARGVEARCSGKHARRATALYHTGQLAEKIDDAGGTLVPWLGKSGVGGFAEESHGTVIELPKGFKRDRTERIFRADMVDRVVPTLVYVPKSSDMARGAGGGMNARSCQGMVDRESPRAANLR